MGSHVHAALHFTPTCGGAGRQDFVQEASIQAWVPTCMLPPTCGGADSSMQSA